MPQKHPPATTAVCSDLPAERGASTAGLGTATLRSAALQIATANNRVDGIADKREKERDIVSPSSLHNPAQADIVRVLSRGKVTYIVGCKSLDLPPAGQTEQLAISAGLLANC